MDVVLLGPAESELAEAIDWYSAQSPGLEKQFVNEVEAAGETISLHPNAWPELGDGRGRYRLSRFPYGLVYALCDAKVIVVAVAHLHRKPDHWRHRL